MIRSFVHGGIVWTSPCYCTSQIWSVLVIPTLLACPSSLSVLEMSYFPNGRFLQLVYIVRGCVGVGYPTAQHSLLWSFMLRECTFKLGVIDNFIRRFVVVKGGHSLTLLTLSWGEYSIQLSLSCGDVLVMAFCEDVGTLILFCRFATAFAQSGACWNPSSAISIGKVVLVKEFWTRWGLEQLQGRWTVVDGSFVSDSTSLTPKSC